MEELFREALHEITGQPLIFAAEVVQFLLLVLLIRLLLRRTLGKDLKERRVRIAGEIERAKRADEEYAGTQQQAASIVAEAHTEAQRVIEAARSSSQERHRIGLEQAEQEENAIILQAQETIKTERERVILEASEQLADLITLVTRRFIEEALSESERRALTQKLILTRLEEMEGIMPQQ
jgi:F-type H+-transporting ATPase subunit b